MTAITDSFEVILIQSKVRTILIRYDVMHQCSSAYLPCPLLTLLAFIVIPAQDVWTHLLPLGGMIKLKLIFSGHGQHKGTGRLTCPGLRRDIE